MVPLRVAWQVPIAVAALNIAVSCICYIHEIVKKPEVGSPKVGSVASVLVNRLCVVIWLEDELPLVNRENE